MTVLGVFASASAVREKTLLSAAQKICQLNPIKMNQNIELFII